MRDLFFNLLVGLYCNTFKCAYSCCRFILYIHENFWPLNDKDSYGSFLTDVNHGYGSKGLTESIEFH